MTPAELLAASAAGACPVLAGFVVAVAVITAHRSFVRRYVDHDLRARARRELEERRR